MSPHRSRRVGDLGHELGKLIDAKQALVAHRFDGPAVRVDLVVRRTEHVMRALMTVPEKLHLGTEPEQNSWIHFDRWRQAGGRSTDVG
jgi:hypothetical protein